MFRMQKVGRKLRRVGRKSYVLHKSREKTPKGREKTTTSREKIITLLTQDGKLSAASLAETIGITPKAVEKHLAKLKAEGIIQRIGPAKGGLGLRCKGTPILLPLQRKCLHKACDGSCVGGDVMEVYLCNTFSKKRTLLELAVSLGSLILTWGRAFVIYAEVICFPLLYCEFCTTFGNS